MYEKMRAYWKRSGYERLNEGSTRRKMNKAELGTKKRRRFWGIKIKQRLKLTKFSSPKRLFVWLRDAYVNMMLKLANSNMVSSGAYGGGAIGTGFGQSSLKEYDEKMIIEIYKKLVMAHSQATVDATKFVSNSVPRLAAIAE